MPRTDQPVAPGPGGPERQALRLPGHAAGRGAPHPGDTVPPPHDGGAGGGFGRLDPEAIQRVRSEAWPASRDEDELHDALVCARFHGAGRSR